GGNPPIPLMRLQPGALRQHDSRDAEAAAALLEANRCGRADFGPSRSILQVDDLDGACCKRTTEKRAADARKALGSVGGEQLDRATLCGWRSDLRSRQRERQCL